MSSNFNLNFPPIELFYRQTYKKVFEYDLIMVIPKGQKCFVWFTNNNCFVLNISSSFMCKNKKIYHLSNPNLKTNKFHLELAKGMGTILYGTIFNSNYFAIEDIFYYKGNRMSSNFLFKLNTIYSILKNQLYSSRDSSNDLLFGIPFMHSGIPHENIETEVSYPIDELKYIIQNQNVFFKYASLSSSSSLSTSINTNKYKTFRIKSDIKSDIYHLYQLNQSTNTYEYYDVAFIPNYKTSVLMNKLFRNLKEHNNLDYLEESDDEDNVKKIDTELHHDIECTYIRKFNKWAPIKLK